MLERRTSDDPDAASLIFLFVSVVSDFGLAVQRDSRPTHSSSCRGLLEWLEWPMRCDGLMAESVVRSSVAHNIPNCGIRILTLWRDFPDFFATSLIILLLASALSPRFAPMNGRDSSYSAAEAAALSLASAALAAFGTYVVTGYLESRREEKARALRRAELNAERALSKKSREEGDSPKGTLIQDVRIDEIYLWEVQNLGEFFSSEAAGLVNHMHGVGSYQKYTDDSTGYFSKLSLSTHSADEADPKKTHYNKLIGSHECILSDLVRKPGAPGVVQKTTAYCRAGVSSGFSNLGYLRLR